MQHQHQVSATWNTQYKALEQGISLSGNHITALQPIDNPSIHKMAVNPADDTKPKVSDSFAPTSAIQVSPSEGSEESTRKLTWKEARAEMQKFRKGLEDASPAEKGRIHAESTW